MSTVLDGDAVVTEACPIATPAMAFKKKYEAPFPMWPGAVRHKQPPLLTL